MMISYPSKQDLEAAVDCILDAMQIIESYALVEPAINALEDALTLLGYGEEV